VNLLVSRNGLLPADSRTTGAWMWLLCMCQGETYAACVVIWLT